MVLVWQMKINHKDVEVCVIAQRRLVLFLIRFAFAGGKSVCCPKPTPEPTPTPKPTPMQPAATPPPTPDCSQQTPRTTCGAPGVGSV